MTRLEQAQEILRLYKLTGQLLQESADALKFALQDPGDCDRIKEAERKLAECKLVNAEFKMKVEQWQKN